MKKRLIAIWIMVGIFLLGGCATFGINQRFWTASDANKFRVGMTKQELIEAIGYPPSSSSRPDLFFSQYTKTVFTQDGKEEVWTYEEGIAGFGGGIRYCIFYFKNEKLVKVEEVTR